MSVLKQEGNRLIYSYDAEKLWLEPWGKNSLRVRAAKQAEMPQEDWALLRPAEASAEIAITEEQGELQNGKLRAVVTKSGQSTFFHQDGRVLLKEYSRLRSSEKSLLFFINSVSKLTAAERELVRLLLEDKKVKEIAELRCVELVTVKTQIKSLLRKFGCSRTREIVETIRELNVAHLF